LHQLNILLRKQSKYCPQNSAFKQYYLRKQELVFCALDTATSLLSGVFLRPIAARLSKCPPFFGMVILMTFVATLRIYGIASRNFILVSLWVWWHTQAQCDLREFVGHT